MPHKKKGAEDVTEDYHHFLIYKENITNIDSLERSKLWSLDSTHFFLRFLNETWEKTEPGEVRFFQSWQYVNVRSLGLGILPLLTNVSALHLFNSLYRMWSSQGTALYFSTFVKMCSMLENNWKTLDLFLLIFS